MKSKYSVIYLYPYASNDTLNWLTNTNQHLSNYAQTLFLSEDDYYRPIQIKHVLTNWQTFKEAVFYFCQLIFKKNYIRLKFYDYLPFTRFDFVKKINRSLFFLPISIFHQHIKRDQKVVLIVSYPTQITSILIKKIKPDFIIGDVVDIWTQEMFEHLKTYDLALTNSSPLFKISKKYNSNTHLISAGYFSVPFIQKLHSKNIYDPLSKNILFIGNITWRQDFDLLQKIIPKLQDYKFIFVCTDLFYIVKDPDPTRLNTQEEKWQKIKKFSNVEIINIKNGDDLEDLNLKACMGIIPLVENEFNHYCHPIKFYYYLGLKLPTVSVPLNSIKDFAQNPDILSFAATPEDWIKTIKKISQTKVKAQSFKNTIQFVYKETFEEKAKSISVLIDKLIASA